MKILKLLIIVFFFNLALMSCGTFNEAGKVLRNEKKDTTDEFLVKKRGALTEPPDFEKIPEPSTLKNKKTSDKEKLKKILKASDNKNKNVKKGNSSTEKSILNKIK